MTRPITTIHNIETNEIETREMNDAEFAAYEALEIELAKEAEAKAKVEANKAALLAKLGITADEATLLLS